MTITTELQVMTSSVTSKYPYLIPILLLLVTIAVLIYYWYND